MTQRVEFGWRKKRDIIIGLFKKWGRATRRLLYEKLQK